MTKEKTSLNLQKEEWNIWDETDPRVRSEETGRIKGKPLSFQERTNVIKLLDKGYSHKKIQECLNIHPRTIAMLKKQIKEQNIPVSALGTLGVPRPGVQGGYRWSRMSEEQKSMCSRIAIENPTYTLSQIQKSLLEVYPDLTVSEPTIWRALRKSGLHFMRAKMKDPRAEGSASHKAELESFVEEQQKGDKGKFDVEDLFFMDETSIYLNETPSYAWGFRENGKRKEAELIKTKGKTVTINVYAGIGLMKQRAKYSTEMKAPGCSLDMNAPRCNAFKLSEDGCWSKFEQVELPKFCLVWWMRPPERETDALPRFLEVNDLFDNSFLLPNVTNDSHFRSLSGLGKPLLKRLGSAEKLQVFLTGRNINGIYTATVDLKEYKLEILQNFTDNDDVIKIIDSDFQESWTDLTKNIVLELPESIYIRNSTASKEDAKLIDEFIDLTENDVLMNNLNDTDLQKYLWFCDIEVREVNDEGELIRAAKDELTFDAQGDAVEVTFSTPRKRKEMLLKKMGQLVKFAKTNRGFPPSDIPRNFHSMRSFKGGAINSARGDRGLFLRYIRYAYKFYEKFWRPSTSDFRFAWDSAPQHGKVDITSKKKSFIHQWVENNFGSPNHRVEAFFLPVRKPDFNPVELLFSFVKTSVRRRMNAVTGSLTPRQMVSLLDKAFSEVSEAMLKGWLRFGCYEVEGEPPTSFCKIRNEQSIPVANVLRQIFSDYDFNESHISKAEFLTLIKTDFNKAMIQAFSIFKHEDGLKNLEDSDILRNAAKLNVTKDNVVQTENILECAQEVLDDSSKTIQKMNLDPLSVIVIQNKNVTITFENHFQNEDVFISQATKCADGESLSCLIEYMKQKNLVDVDFYETRLKKLAKHFQMKKGLLSILSYGVRRVNSLAALFVKSNYTSNEELLSLLLTSNDSSEKGKVYINTEFQNILRDTPYVKNMRQAQFSDFSGRDSLIIMLKAYMFEVARAKKTEKSLFVFCFEKFFGEDENMMTKELFLEKLQAVEDVFFRRKNIPDNQPIYIDVPKLIEEHEAFHKNTGPFERRWPGYPDLSEYEANQYKTIGDSTTFSAEVISVEFEATPNANDTMVTVKISYRESNSNENTDIEVLYNIKNNAPQDNIKIFKQLFDNASEETSENKRLFDLAKQRYKIQQAQIKSAVKTDSRAQTVFSIRRTNFMYKRDTNDELVVKNRSDVENMACDAAVIYKYTHIIPFYSKYSYNEVKQTLSTARRANIIILEEIQSDFDNFNLIVKGEDVESDRNTCDLTLEQMKLLPELLPVSLRVVLPNVKVKKFQAPNVATTSVLKELVDFVNLNSVNYLKKVVARLDAYTTLCKIEFNNEFCLAVNRQENGQDTYSVLIISKLLNEHVKDFIFENDDEKRHEYIHKLCFFEADKFNDLYEQIIQLYKSN